MRLFIFSSLLALVAPQTWAYSVYVENNRADQNSLLGFELSEDGTLKPKPNDNVTTNGKGVVDSTFALGPFDSDQEIVVNPQRTLLFAVNSGSNTIAVFQIGKEGSLRPVAGSPFDSSGINPVSVGLTGNILTVVNKGQDPAQPGGALPNYVNFWVGKNGDLKPVVGSKVEVAAGSSPSQALVSPLGPFIFGADFLGGLLQSFAITKSGVLVHRSSLGLPGAEFKDAATPRFPLGLAAHPHHSLLYVGFPTTNKIGVYHYDRVGRLTFKNTVADSGAVVCWLVTNRQGTRLYASNTGDATVTVYDIQTDAFHPKELQKISLPTAGGAYQLALSPDGRNLLVLTQRYQATTPQGQGNEIHVLHVDVKTGALSLKGLTPTKLDLPGDTRPQGLAVF